MAHVEVMVADQRVHARMTTEQAQSLPLSPEDSVYGILKLRALHGCCQRAKRFNEQVRLNNIILIKDHISGGCPGAASVFRMSFKLYV